MAKSARTAHPAVGRRPLGSRGGQRRGRRCQIMVPRFPRHQPSPLRSSAVPGGSGPDTAGPTSFDEVSAWHLLVDTKVPPLEAARKSFIMRGLPNERSRLCPPGGNTGLPSVAV